METFANGSHTNGVIGQAENQLKNQVDNPVEHATRNPSGKSLIMKSTVEFLDQLFSQLGLSNKVKNRKKYLNPLMELGWIQIIQVHQLTRIKVLRLPNPEKEF